MRRPIHRAALAALSLAALCSIAAAQQPAGQPAEDDVPEMSTSDAAPPASAPAPARGAGTTSSATKGTAGGTGGALASDLLSMAIPGGLSGDAAILKSKIDAGQTVAIAVKFELTPDGFPRDVTLVRGTGIASIDKAIVEGFSQRPPSGAGGMKELAGFTNFRFEISVSKARLAAAASAMAPTAARADELAEQGNAFMVLMKAQMKGDPDVESIARGITFSHEGLQLGFRADIDMALLNRIAATRGAPRLQ